LGDDPIYWPENQGFDVNIGGYRWGSPGSYFYPYHGNRRDGKHPPNLEEGVAGEYLTDRLTDEAIAFIRAHKDQPFFLYFPHYAVHTPIQAHDSITQYFQGKVRDNLRHQNPTYAAMIYSMDQSLGRLRSTLKELQLEEQTAIFFTSDNGGLELRNITDNGIIRDGKGSAYEGGVRVPFISVIPGVTGHGIELNTPVIGMDLFPTILDLAGVPHSQHDGRTIMPLLRDTDDMLARSALFWHYPHYHAGGATPYSAMRKGNYKLIEFFEDGRLEVYNLEKDIGEEQNLADSLPELTRQLHHELQAWRDDVNAQYPTANPDYDPNINY
jgi:arylsulfatase A-like enzyme